jgi:hypothetical protein
MRSSRDILYRYITYNRIYLTKTSIPFHRVCFLDHVDQAKKIGYFADFRHCMGNNASISCSFTGNHVCASISDRKISAIDLLIEQFVNIRSDRISAWYVAKERLHCWFSDMILLREPWYYFDICDLLRFGPYGTVSSGGAFDSKKMIILLIRPSYS